MAVTFDLGPCSMFVLPNSPSAKPNNILSSESTRALIHMHPNSYLCDKTWVQMFYFLTRTKSQIKKLLTICLENAWTWNIFLHAHPQCLISVRSSV